MRLLSAVMLMLSSAGSAGTLEAMVEDVHANPAPFDGKRLRLCGEVSKDGTILYSDTVFPIHGRVGIKLRGYSGKGRGHCVTGILLRADGRAPDDVKDILVTDAPVHPDYVLVAP